jgi:hypothetical protein
MCVLYSKEREKERERQTDTEREIFEDLVTKFSLPSLSLQRPGYQVLEETRGICTGPVTGPSARAAVLQR